MSHDRFPVGFVQGEITALVRLDEEEIRMRKANADDQTYANRIYPHGSNDLNHVAMPGDGVVGRRGAKSWTSKTHELGVVSSNGAKIGPAEERNYYFIGVTKTESGDQPNGSDPNGAGFSAYRAGKVSIVNNNSRLEDIHAGDFVIWQFQPIDSARNLNQSQRFSVTANGTPATKAAIEYAPLNVTDLGGYLPLIKATLASLAGKNAKVMDFFHDQKNRTQMYTDIQEETMRWVLGITGLMNDATWYANGNELNWPVVLRELMPLLENKIEKLNPNGDNLRAHLRSKALSYLCEATTCAMLAKVSRIVGVAMGSARPGDTFPCSLGIVNVGL